MPVLTRTYDETTAALAEAVSRARLGDTDRAEALRKLHAVARAAEEDFAPVAGSEREAAFARMLAAERREAAGYGGRVVARGRTAREAGGQLGLF